jgi:hypothetical protein
MTIKCPNLYIYSVRLEFGKELFCNCLDVYETRSDLLLQYHFSSQITGALDLVHFPVSHKMFLNPVIQRVVPIVIILSRIRDG